MAACPAAGAARRSGSSGIKLFAQAGFARQYWAVLLAQEGNCTP